jgi:CBS domain-containing protein
MPPTVGDERVSLHVWLPDAQRVDPADQRAIQVKSTLEIVSYPVTTVTEEVEVDEVVNRKIAYQVHSFPFVRNGVPVSMVARHDLLLMIR